MLAIAKDVEEMERPAAPAAAATERRALKASGEEISPAAAPAMAAPVARTLEAEASGARTVPAAQPVQLRTRSRTDPRLCN